MLLTRPTMAGVNSDLNAVQAKLANLAALAAIFNVTVIASSIR